MTTETQRKKWHLETRNEVRRKVQDWLETVYADPRYGNAWDADNNLPYCVDRTPQGRHKRNGYVIFGSNFRMSLQIAQQRCVGFVGVYVRLPGPGEWYNPDNMEVHVGSMGIEKAWILPENLPAMLAVAEAICDTEGKL